MAKLDEITELLVDEINVFEKSVNRLEVLQKSLKGFRLQPDTSVINFILEKYNDTQKRIIDEQHKTMARVIRHIDKSIVFPKWLVKLIFGLLLCVIIIFGFSFYKVSRISEIEKEAFKQGENKAVGHFRQFLEQTPEASTLYEKWRETKSKK